MKKFVFLYCDIDMSPDARAAWGEWFQNLGDRVIDSGNPLAPGRWVTATGGAAVADGGPARSRHISIVGAADLAEAEALAAACPAVSGVLVFEALAM